MAESASIFHGRRRRFMLAAATGIALAAGAVSAQTVQVGIAAAIVGDVRISNAAAPAERKIARKQRVSWGDVIRTRKKSQLQILLLDRSNFSIGANTRIQIDRFVYDPNEGRSFVARVLEGAFRFMSGRENANSTATVDSPIGTIGIRGTALDGVVGEDAVEIAEDEPAIGRVRSDEDTATLVVLRGPGAATQGGLTPGVAQVTAAGKTVTLDQPELAAYIPRPGAEPIGPFRLSPAGLSEMQDLLAPSVARAGKGNRNLLGAIVAGAVAVGAAAVLLSDDDDDQPPGTPQGGQDTGQSPPRQPTGRGGSGPSR